MKRYFFYILFLNALTTHSLIGYSQQTTPNAIITPVNSGDTSEVNIIGSNRLTLLKTDDTTTLQILAGHVKLKQGKTFFRSEEHTSELQSH